jgi:hypothetical protein
MKGDMTETGRHTLTERELDAAIDTVARDMTDAEPSASFRAHVLERVESNRQRPAVATRWALAGAAAAIALAVATAVWVTGRHQETPGAPVQSAALRPPALPAQPAAASNIVGQPRAGVGAEATPAASQSARRRPPAPSSAPEREIEPSGAIPALRIEPISGSPPIRIDTVSIETLGISEMTIQPLQIGPLDAGRGTVGDSDR